VATSGAWRCDGAPAPTAEGPGGAVKIGPAKRCSYTYEAATSTGALSVAGPASPRVYWDGLQVLAGAGEAPVQSACAAPAALALEVDSVDGGPVSVGLAGLCGAETALAWRCGTPNATSWRTEPADRWASVDPLVAVGGAPLRCRADFAPAEALPCEDALDEVYGVGTCAELLRDLTCAGDFCETCAHAYACDATCGLCPGATPPPTAAPDCQRVSVDMRDKFGDGWNGAAWLLRERWDGATDHDTYHKSGTLNKGNHKVQNLCLPVDACYDFSLSAGAFPREVKWQFCGAAGGAPYDGRFCVSEGYGCEKELVPGVLASLSTTPVNGSCAGVDVPTVQLRAPDLYAGVIAVIEPYFEDRTDQGGGTVFRAAASHDGFAITWDDQPPGSETDCDLDIVATTAWEVALEGDVLKVSVSNNIGASDTNDNDAAGVKLTGYAPVVGLRDSAPTRDDFFYRVVDLDGAFTLRALETGDVIATEAPFVLPDGCYTMDVKKGKTWSLCDDVGETSTGAPYVFCVTEGLCASGFAAARHQRKARAEELPQARGRRRPAPRRRPRSPRRRASRRTCGSCCTGAPARRRARTRRTWSSRWPWSTPGAGAGAADDASAGVERRGGEPRR